MYVGIVTDIIVDTQIHTLYTIAIQSSDGVSWETVVLITFQLLCGWVYFSKL